MRYSWDLHQQLAQDLNGSANYQFKTLDTFSLTFKAPGTEQKEHK